MPDLKLIRKAFDLADNWEYNIEPVEPEFVYLTAANGTYWHMNEEPIELEDLPNIFVDALAIQLLRQANQIVVGGKFTHSGNSIDVIETIVRWQERRAPADG